MCVVSMVHDHFNPMIPQRGWEIQGPLIPKIDAQPMMPVPFGAQQVQVSAFTLMPTPAEIAELRKVIAEFREAVAAAKVVDQLTGQADCVDPEKAKLEERVAVLEEKLAAISAWGGPP